MPHPLPDLVSEPRFRTYRDACGGDDERAADLYVVNMRLSAAAYQALQMCEVLLRNAMEPKIADWNVALGGSRSWTTAPEGMLRACFVGDAQDLKDAREKADKATQRRRQYHHDDVIAQMSFGTWRFMLPSANHFAKQRLWDESLHMAFANLHVPNKILVDWVSMAYDLRNRVAHHEPIFALDLSARRRAMKDITQTISKPARTWFVANDPFYEEIDANRALLDSLSTSE